jgi:hypothetical protein
MSAAPPQSLPESNLGAVVESGELGELVDYLVRSSRVSPAEARRLILEILAFLDETPEAFVRRRHLQLQAQGLANEVIFAQLKRELEQRRFRAPELTLRQIRRLIYG